MKGLGVRAYERSARQELLLPPASSCSARETPIRSVRNVRIHHRDTETQREDGDFYETGAALHLILPAPFSVLLCALCTTNLKFLRAPQRILPKMVAADLGCGRSPRCGSVVKTYSCGERGALSAPRKLPGVCAGDKHAGGLANQRSRPCRLDPRLRRTEPRLVQRAPLSDLLRATSCGRGALLGQRMR